MMDHAQQETALLGDGAISHAARSGEESDQLLSARPIELNYLTDTLQAARLTKKEEGKKQ
jgi:hypothetical protein